MVVFINITQIIVNMNYQWGKKASNQAFILFHLNFNLY